MSRRPPLSGRRSSASLLVAGLGFAVALSSCEREPERREPKNESERILEQLGSLPYVSTVRSAPSDRGKSGVVVHDPARAWPGVNLFTPRPEPEARLLSMDGQVIHTWRSDLGQPQGGSAAIMDFLLGWHHVEPLGGGRILAIVENRMVLALDADSRALWTAEIPAHHDLAVHESGELYTLCARRRPADLVGSSLPILDEEVTVLSSEGELKRRFSILDLLRQDRRTKAVVEQGIRRRLRIYAEEMEKFRASFRAALAPVGERAIREHLARLDEVLAGTFSGDETLAVGTLRDTPSDFLHANSIEILADHPGGLWKRGDLLLSLRNLNTIAVVDMSGPRLSWLWGPGVVNQQHQPSALPDGKILLFDNGVNRRRSRVLEIEPTSKKITWTFAGDPPESFFSAVRGGVESLPNGDVLVTDSDRGRVFEVTRAGDVVWEYLSPERDGQGDGRVAIYRMTRRSREEVLGAGGG